MSGQRAGVQVTRDTDRVRATAPSGRNKWFLILGFAFAGPWLTAFLVGSVLGVWLYDPAQRKFVILAVLWLNVLAGIIHVLAVVFLWLALYALRGEERISLDKERMEVRRVVLGIGVPFRLKRTRGDSARILESHEHGPGRGPHPRLEWNAGKSAIRFGSGLAAAEAERVTAALNAFARLDAPKDLRGPRTSLAHSHALR